MAEGVGCRIRANIRQVNKQVPLAVVRAESAIFLLHCVYLYTNRQFRADAAINHVSQGSTFKHAHVILIFKALDLGARHNLRHRLVPYVHRVIYPWNKLGGVAENERVHFKAEANELDFWIPFDLVFE